MNNIAILKISPKVNFDKEKYERRIWKACLPLSYSSTDNFEWDKCKAYGWGQDKNKDDKYVHKLTQNQNQTHNFLNRINLQI